MVAQTRLNATPYVRRTLPVFLYNFYWKYFSLRQTLSELRSKCALNARKISAIYVGFNLTVMLKLLSRNPKHQILYKFVQQLLNFS